MQPSPPETATAHVAAHPVRIGVSLTGSNADTRIPIARRCWPGPLGIFQRIARKHGTKDLIDVPDPSSIPTRSTPRPRSLAHPR